MASHLVHRDVLTRPLEGWDEDELAGDVTGLSLAVGLGNVVKRERAGTDAELSLLDERGKLQAGGVAQLGSRVRARASGRRILTGGRDLIALCDLSPGLKD